MISQETLSIYIMVCVLAPLIGSFTLLFLFIFEKQIDTLKDHAKNLALERELQQTRIDVLSQQIQPHFFFNTLNVITSLARLDRKQDLIHSVETFSKFMKHKYTSNKSLSTIGMEMQYTQYYLDIQKLRFGERLHIRQDIPARLLNETIPSYAIQTFVENSFKHSFEIYEGPAKLAITLQEDNGYLMLEVWNNKNRPDDEDKDKNHDLKGIGLTNIHNRLALMYPESQTELTFNENTNGSFILMKWPVQLNEKEDNK